METTPKLVSITRDMVEDMIMDTIFLGIFKPKIWSFHERHFLIRLDNHNNDDLLGPANERPYVFWGSTEEILPLKVVMDKKFDFEIELLKDLLDVSYDFRRHERAA